MLDAGKEEVTVMLLAEVVVLGDAEDEGGMVLPMMLGIELGVELVEGAVDERLDELLEPKVLSSVIDVWGFDGLRVEIGIGEELDS